MMGINLRSDDQLQIVKIANQGGGSTVNSVLVHGQERACSKPFICSESEQEELIDLWNSLPHAGQMRCHEPGFAVRVLSKKLIVFTATICWQCNNIHIYGEAANLQQRMFDGKSKEAIDLLNWCQSRFPD